MKIPSLLARPSPGRGASHPKVRAGKTLTIRRQRLTARKTSIMRRRSGL